MRALPLLLALSLPLFALEEMGSPILNLQLGYEYSDFDDSSDLDAAEGLTLRARYGYQTKEWNHISGKIVGQSIINFTEDFRYPGGGADDHDIIADPPGTRIHEGYLDFTLIPDTLVRVGRQEIILDDARLLGNVGWRANAQSVDGVLVSYSGIEDYAFAAAYVNQVNTILKTGLDLESLVVLHAARTASEGHRQALFSYLLDHEDDTGVADSATFGARFDGDCGLAYDLSAAWQTDYQDSADSDANMVSAYLAKEIETVKVGAGYSRLSGQDGDDRPFDTLVGTAHKFNGWTDQFLGTNGGGVAAGLQDTWIDASTSVKGTKLLARYHWFRTAEDVPSQYAGAYGRELELLAKRKINERVSALLKFAQYDAEATSGPGSVDETVLWARVTIQL